MLVGFFPEKIHGTFPDIIIKGILGIKQECTCRKTKLPTLVLYVRLKLYRQQLFASSKLYYHMHSMYTKCEDNGKMNTTLSHNEE